MSKGKMLLSWQTPPPPIVLGWFRNTLKRRPLLQTSSPLKADYLTENSHSDWYYKRGHFIRSLNFKLA